MKIRWGHFSDLHFQFARKEFNTGDLRDKLVEKVKEYADKNGKFDYLFISGDIFHKGSNEENDVNEAAKYIFGIAEAAQCDMENIVICPGNHDLKRSKARKQNLDLVLENYQESNSLQYNGYYPIVVENVCTPLGNLYRKINSRMKSDKLHYCIELGEINLYVLNTAVFAGQTYPGQKSPKRELEDTNLYICDENLYHMRRAVSDKEKKLNIVLAHHGTECISDKERQQFLNFLGDLKTDIYMCGHVHKSIVRTLDEAGGAYQCSCGGLFVDNYNTPSFIIGEYETDTGEIILRNYQYILNVNAWRPSNSLSEPYNENGIMSWTPKRFRKKGQKQ